MLSDSSLLPFLGRLCCLSKVRVRVRVRVKTKRKRKRKRKKRIGT
jgi:hypothetical protein